MYEAALLASFDRMMLGDAQRLRYLLLVPEPRERPHSSLGFMMDVVARRRGDGEHGWYAHDDLLEVERFLDDARRACAEGVPVCLATTAFALSLIHISSAALSRANVYVPVRYGKPLPFVSDAVNCVVNPAGAGFVPTAVITGVSGARTFADGIS